MNLSARVTEPAGGIDLRLRARADLVGRVIWRMVEEMGLQGGRSLLLLAGLTGEYLAGLSRTFPASGGLYRLAIDPAIDPAALGGLPSDHLNAAPVVRLRNTDAEGVVLIAVPDRERADVGASLGSVITLDRGAIQAATTAWLKEMEASFPVELGEPKRAYMRAMIEGLARSGVTKDLDQFARVIDVFIADPAPSFDERLRDTSPVLRLPRNAYAKPPSATAQKSLTMATFRSMFRTAERDLRNIPFLLGPDQKRLDHEAIAARVRELRDRGAAGEDAPPEEALSAVEALLADRARLRHGDWRPSQQAFCEVFDWKAYGKSIFEARATRPTASLAEQTRVFFEDEHPQRLTDEDRALLSDLEANAASDERAEEFFERQHDLLAQNRTLHSAWRKKIYPDVVRDEEDLLSAILRGARMLLVKASDAETGRLPSGVRIAVSAKSAEKLSSWSKLDRSVYALFRLEMQLLQGAFGDLLEVDLGRWLDPKAIGDARDSTVADARAIELEMRLLGEGGDEVGQRVRAIWRPCPPRERSIALSLPADIERLHKAIREDGARLRRETITPTGRGDDAATTLHRVESFGDASGGDNGRTADPSEIAPGEEWFERLEAELDRLASEHRVEPTQGRSVMDALAPFRAAFTSALRSIQEKPSLCFAGDAIPAAAEAFGALCEAARLALWRDADARATALRMIAEFGLAVSSTSVALAVVPAWHPLRLLERRSKALAVAELLREAVEGAEATSDGIDAEVAAYLRALERWYCPEVACVRHEVYAAVEDVGGYSLMVPVEHAGWNTQALEASARPACEQFMKAAQEYLRLNPHEETNFSTAIYNAESVELPRLIADALEARLDEREHVRCSLHITHDDAARVRRTYALQNARLQGRRSSVEGGFLSRLRVGVRESAGRSAAGQRPDIDIAFLHDAFVRRAVPRWRFAPGAAASQPEAFDLRSSLRPRSRSGQAGGSAPHTMEVALVVDNPPRAVARFIDACSCVASEDGRAIPQGERAVPVRQLSWSSSSDPVRRIVEHAHDMAEWVVSYDRLSSRAMLAEAGIKVIRDVVVADTGARVLVSSREPSTNLLRVIREAFAAMAQPILAADPQAAANRVVATVVDVCGQKVMAAGRSKNAALEIIGLAAATALVRCAPETASTPLLWLSLDDTRTIFGLKGQVADTLAVSVASQPDGGYSMSLTVVEAKCVSATSATAEAQASLRQLASTCGVFRAQIVEQEDPSARRGWGIQVLPLLAAKPEYASFFGTPAEREAFEQALLEGKVPVRLTGRSVVAAYDDEDALSELGTAPCGADEAIVQHRFGQRALAALIAALFDPTAAPAVPPIGGDSDARHPIAISSAEQEPARRQPADPLASPSADEAASRPPLAPGRPQDGPGRSARAGAPASGDPGAAGEGASGATDAGGPLATTSAGASDAHPAFPSAFADHLRAIASRAGAPAAAEAESAHGADVARRLQAALVDFNMNAALTESPITTTPNGVIVRFRGNQSLTVKRIETRRSELRTTHGLTVTRVLEGEGEIGLFVARKDRRIVDLARTWLEVAWPDSAPRSLTSFLVGLREDNGRPLWLNLDGSFGGQGEHAPHTLIAGETGSGKGVLTQNLLLQMVALNDPRNLRLRLVDPKQGVDFFWIEAAPHLDGGIVATQEEAGRALDDLVVEMERRYGLLRARKVPNIREYNARVPEPDRLPRIVLIHDEMADWMSGSEDYRAKILSTMTPLASKARAAGIHVFMITQRAAQDAIPPGIRDNLGNRLVLKVAGEAGSMLALKAPGAERLLGKGHVAASLSGDRPESGEHFVAQTPFASTEDLARLGMAAIEYWRGS